MRGRFANRKKAPQALNVNNRRWSEAEPAGRGIQIIPSLQELNGRFCSTLAGLGLVFCLAAGSVSLHRRLLTLRACGADNVAQEWFKNRPDVCFHDKISCLIGEVEMKYKSVCLIALPLFILFFAGCQNGTREKTPANKIHVVASDTILSGMSEALLPTDRFEVAVILPPGQCPGHYDLKLSDIARVKNADLVVYFRWMPFMQGAEIDENRHFPVDSRGRNWMVPDAYIAGLEALADKFSELFPESAQLINERKEQTAREVAEKNAALNERIKSAGVGQKPIIASSMIKEPLEWMGFRVAGEYDRPESISAKEIANLVRTGKAEGVVMVVDNLQSGPDAGKGISEALDIPHVILANFPLENGYAATLEDNVNAALNALF